MHENQSQAAQFQPYGAGYVDKSPGTAAGTPRRPEVAEQVDKLEKAVAFAEESLNELVARLGGVMRPASPEPTMPGQQLASVGPCTGYGAQLHEQSTRVYSAAERLQEVLRRLEV